MDEPVAALVAPFYLAVLHGNMVSPGFRGTPGELLQQMRAVAPAVTLEDALYLWPRGNLGGYLEVVRRMMAFADAVARPVT